MADQLLVAVGSALLGALAGGGASAIGSYYVTRANRRDEARAAIFLELLPELEEAERVGFRHTAFRAGDERSSLIVAKDIVRTAALVGKEDFKLARALEACVDKQSKAAGPEAAAAKEAADAAIEKLRNQLVRKLSNVDL